MSLKAVAGELHFQRQVQQGKLDFSEYKSVSDAAAPGDLIRATTPGCEVNVTDIIVYNDAGVAAVITFYDEDTLTFAYVSCPAGWSDYLELTIAEITCDKVQLWMGRVNTQVTAVEVDVYYNSGWNNIYSGAIVVGSFQEFVIGSEQSVTAMRIRFSASKANRQAEIYESDFNEITGPVKTTQYLAGLDCPNFPHGMDLLSDKLPCPLPY